MTYKAKQSTSEAASRDKNCRVSDYRRDDRHYCGKSHLSFAGYFAASAAGGIAGGSYRAITGLSGVVPLVSGHDAFASRLALARMAERSIDAQYYIWHNDTSGQILLKTLYDAAQRGVRVRLLLDDNGVAMDETLAALNAQEVLHRRRRRGDHRRPQHWRRIFPGRR